MLDCRVYMSALVPIKLIRISWCCKLLKLTGLVGTRNWLFRLYVPVTVHREQSVKKE